jgi:hypothetical protein
MHDNPMQTGHPALRAVPCSSIVSRLWLLILRLSIIAPSDQKNQAEPNGKSKRHTNAHNSKESPERIRAP